jgi:membrane associated rhomboid family serine protease
MGIVNKMFGDGLQPKKPFVGNGSFPYNRKQQGSYVTAWIFTLILLLANYDYFIQNGDIYDTGWQLNVGALIGGGLLWYCVIYGVWTMVEKIRK